MNVNDLFAKNQPARRVKPGGLSEAQEKAIEAEFLAAMKPLGQKADEYFRHFHLNGRELFWLLPYETYHDLPIEKAIYVLKYKDYFVHQIKKVELDEMPFL